MLQHGLPFVAHSRCHAGLETVRISRRHCEVIIPKGCEPLAPGAQQPGALGSPRIPRPRRGDPRTCDPSRVGRIVAPSVPGRVASLNPRPNAGNPPGSDDIVGTSDSEGIIRTSGELNRQRSRFSRPFTGVSAAGGVRPVLRHELALVSRSHCHARSRASSSPPNQEARTRA